MEMDDNNPTLPQDIVFNILIRLPVKSLIRFRCVCKHWKNLFKTPSFIAEHLQHSRLQNPALLIGDYHKYDFFRLWLLNRELHVLEVQKDPFIDSIANFVWIIGSCNGLLCIELSGNSGSLLLLWNPAIRELTQVPRAVNCLEDGNFCAGFGFSPTINDYKILKIRFSGNDCLVNQAAVYSLSTGSWRGVELRNLEGLAIKFTSFTTNGAIFWIGLKLGVDIIISFDIATEVFTLIPMPPSPFSVTNTSYPKYLTVYENKLAMLSHTLSEDFKSSLIHLWVMEEGTCASRERWVWTKKYTSRPYLGSLLVPMTIWKNEIVCNVDALPGPIDQIGDEDELNDERKTVMVNFTSNEFKTFDIREFALGYGIFNYVETLVPVGNINIE